MDNFLHLFDNITADDIRSMLSAGDVGWLKTFINMDSFTGLSDVAGAISVGLQPLAGAICCLFMLINLVELAANDKFTLEMFMMFFVKVALSLALIKASPSLIELGNAVSVEASAAVDKFTDSYTNGDSMDDELQSIADELSADTGNKAVNALSNVSIRLSLFMSQLGAFFCSLFVGTVLISRLFELALRGAFMPLAMGFISEEGVKGASMRYLKQYLAVWLQGPAISVCFALFGTIQIQAIKSINEAVPTGLKMFAPVGASIVCFFGLLGACRGTKEICNNALGV